MGFLQSCTLYCASTLLTLLGLYYPQRYRSLFILPTWTLLAFSIGYLKDIWIPGLSFQLGMLCIITILQTPIIFRQHTARRWSWTAAYKSYNNPRMLAPAQLNRRTGSSSWILRIIRPLALYTAKSLLYTALAHLNCTWHDFSPAKESLIRSAAHGHLTLHDLLVRLIVTLVWFLDTAAQLELAHCILALLFVSLLRMDSAHEWPPLFGCPAEAYSVRRFWSRVWHRLFSPSASTWARAIAQRVFGLESTWRSKAFETFLVFCMSGCAHALMAWRLGDGHGGRDVCFFLVNFGAVMMEVLIDKLWISKSGGRNGGQKKPGVGRRACGMVWVGAFFLWVTPRVAYPRLYMELSRRFWAL